MKTIVIKDRIVIPLGKIGDNEATAIKFNIASFFPGLSGALYELVHKLPNKPNAYIVRSREDGRVRDGFITWVVKSSDLGTEPGNGTAILTAYWGNGSVAKSVVFTTQIANGMNVGPDPDTPETPWTKAVFEAGTAVLEAVPVVEEYKNEAKAAAEAAEDAVAGVSTTIDEALAAAKASGDFDGYSPTVDVQPITGGHQVTITDVDGDHTFDVMDGEGGAGSNDIFWATYGTTTASEMDTARQNGKEVLCYYSGSLYRLTAVVHPSDGVVVSLTSPNQDGLWVINVQGSTWLRSVVDYPYSSDSDIPEMDGEADPGPDYGRYARAGHVHPTDTSRAPAAAGVPAGGSKYYALVKASSADYDTEWAQLSKWVNVSYNPTTGVAVANIAPVDLIGQKLDFAIYSSYDNGAHEFNIPMVYAEYFVPGGTGVTYYQFRFEGLAQDTQGNPLVVVYDFPMQERDATSMVGTGTVYKLALST